MKMNRRSGDRRSGDRVIGDLIGDQTRHAMNDRNRRSPIFQSPLAVDRP
jgi:hypothetical protein